MAVDSTLPTGLTLDSDDDAPIADDAPPKGLKLDQDDDAPPQIKAATHVEATHADNPYRGLPEDMNPEETEGQGQQLKAAPGAFRQLLGGLLDSSAMASGETEEQAAARSKRFGLGTTDNPIDQSVRMVGGLGALTPAPESAVAHIPSAVTDAAAAVDHAAPAGSRLDMGAAHVNTSPFQLTGQETGRGSPSFPQVKLAKNAVDVHPDEQATRAGIIKEVLNDSGEDAGIRTGVLTGNEQTLRSEYQAAKNPNQTPANALMAQQIGAEQRALPKFAQQRIDATGADPTLANDYQRGETVNNAFYGENPDDPSSSLKGFLGQQKQKIFQAALEKNGASVIPTETTDDLFADPQFQAGLKLSGHEGVASGAQDLINLAKKTGFKDPVTGEQYAPGSVAAWNAVTKAINKGWSPDNAITVRAINGAINQDIAKSGGGDLYNLGNKVHQLEKSLLSDSPGINKVFGAVDPNGVQTGKPFESIPKTLNDMPLDQWRNIHDILDNLSRGQIRGAPEGMDAVPQSLQDAAKRAKAEMHGSLAREVYAQGAGNAGGWSANAANKALNGRVGQKILDAAAPDEVRKFQTLNAAGQIMPGAHTYEGAGAQTARMASEPGFVESYAPKAAAWIGAAKAGPVGRYLGEKAGSKLSGITKTRREAAHANNVSTTLRNNLNIADSKNVTSRASGGKVDHDALVNQLMTKWKQARKAEGKHTEPLLNIPDAAIIKALEVAQEHI